MATERGAEHLSSYQNALTYADGDVCRPLVVILTGYHLLPYELEANLAFKAQDISI